MFFCIEVWGDVCWKSLRRLVRVGEERRGEDVYLGGRSHELKRKKVPLKSRSFPCGVVGCKQAVTEPDLEYVAAIFSPTCNSAPTGHRVSFLLCSLITGGQSSPAPDSCDHGLTNKQTGKSWNPTFYWFRSISLLLPSYGCKLNGHVWKMKIYLPHR